MLTNKKEYAEKCMLECILLAYNTYVHATLMG